MGSSADRWDLTPAGQVSLVISRVFDTSQETLALRCNNYLKALSSPSRQAGLEIEYEVLILLG